MQNAELLSLWCVLPVVPPSRCWVWSLLQLCCCWSRFPTAQRVVPKLIEDCPIGYADTRNGRCCSFGRRVERLQPRQGRDCPAQWINVGGGYCRRE
ncbi:MAG: hypothetical protein CM15mP77_3620 [Synechococcus sp.]|nr:MAG: hypothetical protein CM15mP77_3620 [Synechococcus sp.]